MTKDCVLRVLSPKGKVRSKADSYRPISLQTSVVNVMERVINANPLGNVMKRLINTILMWFVKNLENGQGQVQTLQHQGRKEITRDGVPQGGVLSLKLFIIYILNGVPFAMVLCTQMT